MDSISFVGKPKELMDFIGSLICEYCYGMGWGSTMERVYSNEPHMAPIGEERCICQYSEPDYESE